MAQKSPEQSQGAIDQLFTGRVSAGSINDPVSGSAGALDTLVSLSGAQIEAIAADQGKPRVERSSAVKALAKAGDKAAEKPAGDKGAEKKPKK